MRPGPGVEVPAPVTVADVDPSGAALAVGGAANRVGLRAHQRLRERGAPSAGADPGSPARAAPPASPKLDTGSCGHRVTPSHRDLWSELNRESRGGRLHVTTPRSPAQNRPPPQRTQPGSSIIRACGQRRRAPIGRSLCLGSSSQPDSAGYVLGDPRWLSVRVRTDRQRFVFCSSSAGYRSPTIVTSDAARSISARSALVSSTAAARRFSCSRGSLVVPGIGTIDVA